MLLGYGSGRFERVAATLDGAQASVPGAIGKSLPGITSSATMKTMLTGLFLLDAKSQAAVIAELPRVSDPFLRALLWGALWDSVRELRMTPVEYLELGLRLLPAEKDAELAVSILGRMRTAFTDYLPDQQRAAIAERFENLLIREIAAAPTADLRITYFRGLIGDRDNTSCARCAQGSVGRAHDDSRSSVEAARSVEHHRGADRGRRSDRGPSCWRRKASAIRRMMDASMRMSPARDSRQPENKKKYFAEYLASSGVKEDWVTASLPSFNYWSQADLTSAYLEPALEALPQIEAGTEDFLRGELARQFRREPAFARRRSRRSIGFWRSNTPIRICG